MSHDVRQWLAEIKSLQQQLVAVQQERDEAYAGAANWRKLYETEAQQRRTDTLLHQQAVAALKIEIEQLRRLPEKDGDDAEVVSAIQTKVGQLDLAQLREQLAQALLECDRLSRALKHEQENHAQMRQALTTALGDTVNMLAKERALRDDSKETSNLHGSSAADSTYTSKIPSLELPPLEQAQSLV